MNFVQQIIDSIGEFEPLKVDALSTILMETPEQEGSPLNITLGFVYERKWRIVLKFVRVKKAKLSFVSNSLFDLGEPSFHQIPSGGLAGLFEFVDELKGYQIVAPEVVVMEICQLS